MQTLDYPSFSKFCSFLATRLFEWFDFSSSSCIFIVLSCVVVVFKVGQDQWEVGKTKPPKKLVIIIIIRRYRSIQWGRTVESS